MRIYDSAKGGLADFSPLEKGKVRIYVCGLTPYDDMHVGHMRTYLFFDVVRRYFEHLGYEVVYTQNITDVEDKVFMRAKALGVHPLGLAKGNMDKALREMDALNIKRPTLMHTVSDNMPAIISIIERLIRNGFAYESGGDVYFSVLKFRDYGALSGQDTAQLISGARVEPGENKRHPLDFALWKSVDDEKEVAFDSPWSRGRPGWHIECSAISTKYLGMEIDIHGGGRDLIFPHHENEIAQSEAAFGGKFVRCWMHTGFLTIGGEKMSKSLGNFITAEELLSKYDADVIRWYLLTRHYRSPIDFAFEKFDEVKVHLDKLSASVEFARTFARRCQGKDEGILLELEERKRQFHSAMRNDFETPGALAELNGIMHSINRRIGDKGVSGESIRKAIEELLGLLSLLGFRAGLKGDGEYEEKLKDICSRHSIKGKHLEDMVENLIAERERLRGKKEYALADEIRDALRNAGIVVEDLKGESIWRRG